MMIILPLGAYPIQWKCPLHRWKDDVTSVALRVTKGQWYMHKMKTQHMQLTQATGDTISTVNDQSSNMGTTAATNGSSSQGTASQGANRPSWQGMQIHKSGTIYTHSYAQTNKDMYNWILLDTCSSIDLFCN